MLLSVLVDGVLSRGRSWVGLGERKSVLLGPGMTSIPASVTTVFMTPSGDDN